MTDHLQFREYVARGLLTVDRLEVEQDGLPLYSSCHQAIDDLNNWGLTFIPTLLESFIKVRVE